MHYPIFQEVPDEIDEAWTHGVILGGMAAGAYDRLSVADAFKLAGDTLLKEALSSREAYLICYPLLFSYRHSVEVYLKLILQTQERTHNIEDLLNQLNSYCLNRYSQQLPQWFTAIILEFDEFDSGSFPFRYDDGIVSKHTGDGGEWWVDLHDLKWAMDRVQQAFYRLIRDSDL